MPNLNYVRMTLPNQNCNDEEMKSRLNLGNSSYIPVHRLLPSHLTKNLKLAETVTSCVILHDIYPFH
jgi:hypothetical protein